MIQGATFPLNYNLAHFFAIQLFPSYANLIPLLRDSALLVQLAHLLQVAHQNQSVTDQIYKQSIYLKRATKKKKLSDQQLNLSIVPMVIPTKVNLIGMN